MPSPRLWFATTLLVLAAALATMVTVMNRRPPPRRVEPSLAERLAGGAAPAPRPALAKEVDSGPVDRLASYYQEYAGGGSCEWRQRMGAPKDLFPTVLLVALLAYPALLGAAVGFLTSLRPAPPGRTPILAAFGLAATGLVLIWLLRLGFVRAALELC